MLISSRIEPRLLNIIFRRQSRVYSSSFLSQANSGDFIGESKDRHRAWGGALQRNEKQVFISLWPEIISGQINHGGVIMLECFFEDETRMRQMRRGPFGEHIDGLAASLRQERYAPTTARGMLTLVGKFSRYAESKGVSDAAKISKELADKFIREELASEGVFRNALNVMAHIMNYLRKQGIIASEPEVPVNDPFMPLLLRYKSNLENIRGLAPATIFHYLRGARRLLEWLRDKRGNKAVGELTGPDVLDFISDRIALYDSPAWRRHLCGETRSFLRFLLWEGITDVDLARVVPKVRKYRLSTVPRHLPWEKVQELINSIATDHPEGKRDKAILTLLACLGMRSGEVRGLTFGQINWRRAEIRLPKTKSCKERVLPLSQEVGDALSDYILNGRPAIDVPQVFLRHRAPQGPFQTHGSIKSIVGRCLERAGMDAPVWGPHLLRHSLATRMVNNGVPIKDISDVLGHASIDTTAIYTKVDVVHLAAVALPFPGGAV